MSLIMHFTRNDNNARTLDSGSTINQTGAYTGMIRQAAIGATNNGAQYIDMTFKADDGRICYPRLFITKNDGSEAFGRKILDALLVVLGQNDADVVEAKVYTKDRNAAGGYRVDQGYRLPAIEGKPVGLLIQRENYEYNGQLKFRLNLITPFDPKTRRVAKEILSNSSEAKLLDERIKNTKDRDDTRQQSTAEQQPPAGHPAASAPDYDDIPL